MNRAAVQSETGAVVAELSYTVDTGVKPVNETFGPGNIRRRTTGTNERRPVTIRDGRPLKDEFDLEVTGFEFVEHKTEVRDFFDAEELKRVYYPEVEALVKKVSGASRVVVFDHTLRSGDEAEREARLVREPVFNVHNDYTEWSGPQRVREILPDEAEALLRRRFAIVQAWRAIDKPIESNPLAIADARSLAPEDLIASERRYPHRVGETYRIRYNPDHRWFYFPEMRRDEALVFKVYDSAKDGRARFTAHSSFDDPTTPADAPPRQSIEARAFAFFAP
ncbi:MAG TPA: CmcJ/NvfI family oxidoreductase [Burkholderiales bacterium]|nr:CmcJ/NvfI family oxidoreductase [Burkholderiales bacterium]